VFVYIGWASKYDGTEAIKGSHRWLRGHPFRNSEARAFKKDDDGFFSGGIGRGLVSDDRVHVVFVASDGQAKRVVGLYAAAHLEASKNKKWTFAYTKHAVLIPAYRRPQLTKRAWAGDQGMRRWAWRSDGGTAYPRLHAMFRQLLERLSTLVPTPPFRRLSLDQTYCDLEMVEGQQRKYLVTHRRREGKLREAKIRATLDAARGRLVCEVPGCLFDFYKRYGDIGYGYAQVHHKRPLGQTRSRGRKTTLEDLAVVCANCHAMIHKGGGCLPIQSLLRSKHAKIRR
jgi:predicted HNH restriction endonuclease